MSKERRGCRSWICSTLLCWPSPDPREWEERSNRSCSHKWCRKLLLSVLTHGPEADNQCKCPWVWERNNNEVTSGLKIPLNHFMVCLVILFWLIWVTGELILLHTRGVWFQPQHINNLGKSVLTEISINYRICLVFWETPSPLLLFPPLVGGFIPVMKLRMK